MVIVHNLDGTIDCDDKYYNAGDLTSECAKPGIWNISDIVVFIYTEYMHIYPKWQPPHSARCQISGERRRVSDEGLSARGSAQVSAKSLRQHLGEAADG